MSEIRVTATDLYECRYCCRGARLKAQQLGFDWMDFLQNGIEISRLENIDDAMIQDVVKHVYKKNGIADE